VRNDRARLAEQRDFTGIDIEYYAGRGVYQLTVTGVKPYTNMEVSLSHEAYSGRPAYWRTVVVGCVKNALAGVRSKMRP